MTTSPNQRLWLGLSRVLYSPWLHPLNDADAWERLRVWMNPMWSRRDYPARVLDIIDETPDTRSFVLKPTARWPGHRAGQHVVVEVEINGRRVHRSFSLSSAPTPDRRLRITVKRQPGARVSGWLHEHVRIGDVLRLSAPTGRFAPAEGAAPLLLLSAGSGITPLMAIVEDLHRRGDPRAIVFIHCCRTPADFIFADRLRVLAAEWPNFELRVHYSASAGRFDVRQLSDLLHCQTLVCGPRALTQNVEALFLAAGVKDQVRSESYSGRVLPHGDATQDSFGVHCSVTEQVFTARGDTSLLEAAEAAGLKPAHGCRIGICKTCQCTKRSGTALNLRTGEISSEPNELIQLCISVARSPLELAL